MNIIINQKKLIEAIRIVERIVSRNISLPILNTILITTEGGKVKLTTTNLELGIQYWVGAKVDNNGTTAVPAKIFSDLISSIQDEKLTISTEKNSVYIHSEHSTTHILGMKPEEFPIIPMLKNTPEFSIQTSQLAVALGKVVDAASILETRPELSGVYIHVEPQSVTCAATDSFRLSEYVLPAKNSIEKSFILPRSTALEILRIISGRDEIFRVGLGENQIVFRGVDVEIVSRLIDGKYPDYKKVIPEHPIASCVVAKQTLEQHIRMAGIFSSSVADVSLKVSQGKLTMMAKNSDRGEISSHIPISETKTNFTTSLNYRYLLDALKVISASDVDIQYTGEGSPLVVRGVGDNQHTYVIMPLRS